MLDADWCGVYLHSPDTDAIHAALTEVMAAAGYRPYNPFPGGAGTARQARELVRVFVAPPEAGWTRLIGCLAETQALAAQLGTPVLLAWAKDDAAHLQAFGPASLTDFLRAGVSEADVWRAPDAAPDAGQLPDELSAFAAAQGVDPQKAQQLFNKRARQLAGKLGGDADDPLATLQGGRFSWQSAAGQQVRHMLACLTVPAPYWHQPDFKTLAGAYQVACLLDIDEDAPLLPGDEALLDAVDYPLDYRLAYFAR